MTAAALPVRNVSLRPLIIPAEHGGWGLVLEPVILGMAVVPSQGGAMIALAALGGFLMRQPLKLALQDRLRHRSVPRTRYCWTIAAALAAIAAAALAAAGLLNGFLFLVPLLLAAPLGLFQLIRDTSSRGRELAPELVGGLAASSIPAAIAFAGGSTVQVAVTLAALITARSIPSILYVRAMLNHSSHRAAIVAAIVAAAATLLAAPPLAALAMCVLLARAVWGLTHPPPPAKTVGWREIAYGVLTTVLLATAL